jgi:hypothetical protein
MKNAGSGITKAKVEEFAPAGRTGTRRLWVAFWDLAERVGPHYVWRGPVDRLERGVFVPARGPALPARQVAWVYDGRELGAGEDLRPSCGRTRCVRPDHQEVRAAP